MKKSDYQCAITKLTSPFYSELTRSFFSGITSVFKITLLRNCKLGFSWSGFPFDRFELLEESFCSFFRFFFYRNFDSSKKPEKLSADFEKVSSIVYKFVGQSWLDFFLQKVSQMVLFLFSHLKISWIDFVRSDLLLNALESQANVSSNKSLLQPKVHPILYFWFLSSRSPLKVHFCSSSIRTRCFKVDPWFGLQVKETFSSKLHSSREWNFFLGKYRPTFFQPGVN